MPVLVYFLAMIPLAADGGALTPGGQLLFLVFQTGYRPPSRSLSCVKAPAP